MIRRVRRKATQAKERSTASSISGAGVDPDAALPPGGNRFAKDASLFPAGGDDDDDVVVVVVEPEREVDWTALPDDTVVALFTRLNYRDRASLASVCCAWRRLGASTYLWNALDLRAHALDATAAASLAGRCAGLQRLRFRGASAAEVLINLQAKDLRDLRGDACRDLTNAYLSMLAARHGRLETLQLGPDCDRITSEAVKVVAFCCPNLRRFRLAGARDVDGDAIHALAKHCPQLSELGLLDCGFFDEAALGSATSLRYLSVAGSRNISWTSAAQHWSKLTNLIALDASRTEISPAAAVQLLTSENLKILCALNCSILEDGSEAIACSTKGKLVLARFTDIMKALDTVSSNFHPTKITKHTDKSMMEWLEWVLSHALLRIAEKYVPGLDGFWLKQGTALMLKLVRSSQEDVQERAATALGTFIVIDEESAIVDPARAEAVMHSGGIAFLLHLARSCREGVQSEAAKAIANLSVNAEVAKAVAEEGGIIILAALARSPNRSVAEEAAGGLWNLSVGEEHKGAIAEAGGIKALVDLVFKWPVGGEGVLERAAGALANLAADDKCSMEVAMAGGVHALVMLARFCKNEGVQEQAARALANLAAHGDSNGNNAAVGQEAGALEALVQLTCSQHEGVRQEAAGALWNLSFDDRNREAIANAGGVEALVALAQSCSTGSQGLQERAAGALWGLSVSEANSIAIGREGGIAPLITLAFSESEDVHETAAGALWNLAFNAVNAWRILEGGGVVALVHLCSSGSKMARFMAALTLAYMFDGRMDSYVTQRVHFEGARLLAKRHIEMFVEGFSDQQMLSAVIVSWGPAALTLVADSARIQEAGHLRCSGSEIGRFVQMLKNSCLILRSCAAFALLQFTMPGGRHAKHHATLLHRMGASRVLRAAAASATAPLQAKVFARIVLRNLEHYPVDAVLV